MKLSVLMLVLLVLTWPHLGMAQPSSDSGGGRIIEIHGDKSQADAEKLTAIWLYPEDYVNQTLKLHGFLFEAENFEYFPEQKGYLFSCEAVIYRDNVYHVHVGNATFLSRKKLNFFCSTEEGERLRQSFKANPTEIATPANVVLKITQRNGYYFADLISYTPKSGKK